MIKTNLGIEIDYVELENALQDRLNNNSALVSPLKVRCFHKEDSLAIIVEHQENVISHPRRIFRIIREAIQEKKIIGDISMYLVVHGKTEAEFFNQITVSSQGKYAQKINNYSSPKSVSNSVDDTDNDVEEKKPTKNKHFTRNFFIISMSFLGISSLIYALSRPCVISKCLLLSQSEELVEESLGMLSKNNETISLTKIRGNITTAINTLQAIPPWSSAYNQAQASLNTYQEKLDNINNLIKVIELENQTKVITEKMPISAEKWQNAINLWQESLNFLAKVKPENNQIFLDKKKQEFEQNIVIAKENIEKEKEAQKYLLLAENTAKLAQSREKEAKTLANLNLVEETWKTAIQTLEKIPLETTIYLKKQELLNIYIPKFLASQQLSKKEEANAILYNEALNQARLAKTYENSNQWSNVVSSWQNAINALSKIPQNAKQYQEALSLTNNYQQELSKAQNKFKNQLLLDSLENDLKTICYDSPKICNYSIANNLVKVFLTNTYIELINNSFVGNNQTIKSHISQLESNLKYVNSKYGFSIEVYHPEGNLMIRY